MMVSTRGRYALRVMIDLAEHNNGKYIPLKDIADRQDISEKYLESIVKSLTKAGMLEGLRGKGGGYRLTKSADQYTVYDILKQTEGSMAPVACLEDGARGCERNSCCSTLAVWEGLDKLIRDYLEKITVAELASRHQPGNDYVI
ncbi:MAG: Rrf2 family transcriptional regulator [Eubacteriales bacterium]|nr:Rrf2 family transcriptional regulator [Eubacteriales bacterium]